MSICSDLCLKDLVETLNIFNPANLSDEDCFSLSSSSLISLARYLRADHIKSSLADHLCYVLRDDSNREIIVARTSSDVNKDRYECVYIDYLLRPRRVCRSVNTLIDNEMLKKLLDYLSIKYVSDEALFNPSQEPILYRATDDFFAIIPPMSFISLDSIEKKRISVIERRASGSDRIVIQNKNTLVIKDPIGIKYTLISDFDRLRCFRNQNLELCYRDDLLIYIDDLRNIVIKGEKLSDLELRINYKSSLVSWSHPLGYASELYRELVDSGLEVWWLDLYNPSSDIHISMASYPYLSVSFLEESLNTRLEIHTPKSSLVIRSGFSLEDNAPWILSHKLIDPFKTNYRSLVERPVLSIAPKKILLYKVTYDSSNDLMYMYIINYLPKDLLVSLISSGYLGKVYVSHIRDLWEEIFSSFNMTRFTAPAYSLVALKLYRERGEKTSLRRLANF